MTFLGRAAEGGARAGRSLVAVRPSMVRIYAFADVFAIDWLPTIISRVVDELTSAGEPNSWVEHTDAVLVRAGKRHWDRLKKERAKAGEERVDEWTLPYLWEWGPHRFRQPVRREIWKRRASALGLPPPPPRKRKTPESEERFTVAGVAFRYHRDQFRHDQKQRDDLLHVSISSR